MIFYHGTTQEAAKSIRKLGLIPHRQTAYKLVTQDGMELRDLPGEDKPYVYLQTLQPIARAYAEFRANYERAAKGEKVTAIGLLTNLWKDTAEQNPTAKPALITFDIPDKITRKLRRDPQNWEHGFVCACVIPPQYIKQVTEVPYV